MFIDKARIFIKSGDGGDGSIHFRREKYVALGGPDGGDGGKGGSVTLVANKDMTTLMDFTYKRKYVACQGENGSKSKCYGKDGEDIVVKVPMGTIVMDEETGKIMADLSHSGDICVVAKGGKGGKGNAKFATPTRQAPGFAEPGMPGEERYIKLELKLLADVGLVGFPNVGKSTLLSVVSKARPKIANYHFTTLKPNLGVVDLKGVESFVIADIPGLIEGASEGVGLGIEFLKHVERTRVLVHIVDLSGLEGRDPIEDVKKINEELKKYSIKLWDRPQIIVANKTDMIYDNNIFENFKDAMKTMGYDNVFKISAVTGQGVEELMKECARLLSVIPVKESEISGEDKFVEEQKAFTYTIDNSEEGVYSITGTFVDRLLYAVNVNEPDSLRYFHKVLKNKGVFEKLREMGVKQGDIIRVNDFQFEYII